MTSLLRPKKAFAFWAQEEDSSSLRKRSGCQEETVVSSNPAFSIDVKHQVNRQ